MEENQTRSLEDIQQEKKQLHFSSWEGHEFPSIELRFFRQKYPNITFSLQKNTTHTLESFILNFGN